MAEDLSYASFAPLHWITNCALASSVARVKCEQDFTIQTVHQRVNSRTRDVTPNRYFGIGISFLNGKIDTLVLGVGEITCQFRSPTHGPKDMHTIITNRLHALQMVLLWLAVGCALAAGAQPRPPVVETAIAAAHAAMLARLEKQYPRDKLVTRVEAGQFDTVIAVAAFPGAYPGTGVMRQIVDMRTGVIYGGNSEQAGRSFADFARDRGWLSTPPDTDALLRMLNTGLFEGVAMLDRTPAPKVTTDATGLRVEVVQRYMPSLGGEWLIVTIPHQGKETVMRTPLSASDKP